MSLKPCRHLAMDFVLFNCPSDVYENKHYSHFTICKLSLRDGPLTSSPPLVSGCLRCFRAGRGAGHWLPDPMLCSRQRAPGARPVPGAALRALFSWIVSFILAERREVCAAMMAHILQRRDSGFCCFQNLQKPQGIADPRRPRGQSPELDSLLTAHRATGLPSALPGGAMKADSSPPPLPLARPVPGRAGAGTPCLLSSGKDTSHIELTPILLHPVWPIPPAATYFQMRSDPGRNGWGVGGAI